MGDKPTLTHIDCECGSEGIMLLADDGRVEISFYKYGFVGGKLPWMSRFRLIWKILTTGVPYSDMVILCKEEVEALKTTLEVLTSKGD